MQTEASECYTYVHYLYERSFRHVQVIVEGVIEHLSSVKLPQISSRLENNRNPSHAYY